MLAVVGTATAAAVPQAAFCVPSTYSSSADLTYAEVCDFVDKWKVQAVCNVPSCKIDDNDGQPHCYA